MSEFVKPVDVTIRSWLNHDGYECEGRGYKMDELSELKSIIGDRPVNWCRGKNTFAGKPVSDKFMQDMKIRLLHELGRSENDKTLPYYYVSVVEYSDYDDDNNYVLMSCDVGIGKTYEKESEFHDNEQGSYSSVETYETIEEVAKVLSGCKNAREYKLDIWDGNMTSTDIAYLKDRGLMTSYGYLSSEKDETAAYKADNTTLGGNKSLPKRSKTLKREDAADDISDAKSQSELSK